METKPPQPQKRIPQTSELVIAQVTKITNFGAYCRLPEYDNMEVFLPIREVSSGWIKNIRTFIHEGQNLVCRVVFFDKERNTLDVSLKKVTPKDSKDKIGAYNLERRLEALFNQVVKSAKDKEAQGMLGQQVMADFGSYTLLARAAVNNSEEFKKSKISKNVKDLVIKALEDNMKKKTAAVSYILKVSTTNTKSGISEMRKIFTDMKNAGTRIIYISAPKYRLYAEGEDYPEAEAKVKKAVELARAQMDKSFTFEIEKEKLKKEETNIIGQYISK
jgi:translation initiation factor 2 subunit 1